MIFVRYIHLKLYSEIQKINLISKVLSQDIIEVRCLLTVAAQLQEKKREQSKISLTGLGFYFYIC